MYKAEQVLIAGADAGISMKQLTKMLQLLTKNGSSKVSQNSGKPDVSRSVPPVISLNSVQEADWMDVCNIVVTDALVQQKNVADTVEFLMSKYNIGRK